MSKRAFAIGILVSLGLHIALFVSLAFVKPRPEPAREIEISLIEPPAPAKVALPKTQQIVDQDKSLNDELSDDAKHLSRHNQKVIKETRAQNYGKFVNRDQGAAQPAKAAQDHKTQANKKPRAVAKGPGSMPKLKDLKPNLNWSPDAFAQTTPGAGPSQTDDYVKDAQVGVQTLLNTREFIYFSYYSRIKDKLRQYWEPKIKDKVQRLLAQGRTIASSDDRVTKMIITLDNRGTLIKVQVIGESGILDLDQAAVEAFQAAAPFPNPPSGIVEADGTIKIRWDFVLEANNPILRFDRYADSDENSAL